MRIIGWVGAGALSMALLAPMPATAQQGDGTDETTRVSVFKPAKVEASPQRIDALKAPRGFSVNAFATGLKNPRMLAVSSRGDVYVTRREQGDVLMLRDTDGDGVADGAPQVVATRPNVHGLAIHEDRLYLATVNEVVVAPIKGDGSVGALETLIDDLPDGGQHPNRTLAFGPDGQLYVSVGSTCNACNETNPESATVLQATPDGKSRTIFASGLRNLIGFDWHPQTGELWGMDHGIDYLGDDVQPEELNLIRRGKQYGWPHVHGRDGINPQSTPPGGIDKKQWLAMSEPMIDGYTAHAAPMQMLFYRGAGFPSEYAGDAFVAMRGSWNRKPASGYEIVRIRYRDGKPAGFEPFVTGFLTDGGRAHIARPVGLAMAADGSLLMSDDGNGVIYRVAHESGQTSRTQAPPTPRAPAAAMEAQNRQGTGVPLAMTRPETQGGAAGTIKLSSPSIQPRSSIPLRHSEYDAGLSPALQWNAVEGARSYLLIMEDPDARPITPFVHWVAWNIPGDVTSLPEALQEQMRLTRPEGMLQGRTSRGSTGYFGPKPPVGDPPHHYHFQLFALDTMLDLLPGSDRDQVLAAAQGHVIARGELVGTYGQASQPVK